MRGKQISHAKTFPNNLCRYMILLEGKHDSPPLKCGLGIVISFRRPCGMEKGVVMLQWGNLRNTASASYQSCGTLREVGRNRLCFNSSLEVVVSSQFNCFVSCICFSFPFIKKHFTAKIFMSPHPYLLSSKC